MLKVILVMIGGMLTGWLVRKLAARSACCNLKKMADGVGGFLKITIWLLLFVLGLQVGGNDVIMHSLHTLGLEALVIGLLATLGSCVGAWILWRYVSRKGGEA